MHALTCGDMPIARKVVKERAADSKPATAEARQLVGLVGKLNASTHPATLSACFLPCGVHACGMPPAAATARGPLAQTCGSAPEMPRRYGKSVAQSSRTEEAS
jgi:hypothetical protein